MESSFLLLSYLGRKEKEPETEARRKRRGGRRRTITICLHQLPKQGEPLWGGGK